MKIFLQLILLFNVQLQFFIAIKNKEKVHLEIQTSRKSVVGVIRSTYWDSGEKKIKHNNYGRIKGKSLTQLKNIQAAMREETFSAQPFEIINSCEFGATAAIRMLIEELDLSKAFESDVIDKSAEIIGITRDYQSALLPLSEESTPPGYTYEDDRKKTKKEKGVQGTLEDQAARSFLEENEFPLKIPSNAEFKKDVEENRNGPHLLESLYKIKPTSFEDS